MQFANLFDGVADYDQTFALINRGYSPEQRSAGQYFETTEEIYSYFLNVLPPMDYTADAFSMCEFSTGTLTDAYMRFDGRFFCLCISRQNAGDFSDAIRAFRAELATPAVLALPQLTCRKCSADNPAVYFAPVTMDGKGTCVCFDCAKARHWLDQNGDLRPGIEL